jgi:NADPH:quinone reductase-like Zn-dependent oxidoreductase
MPLRTEIWNRLGADLKPARLADIASRTVPLADVVAASQTLMERAARGRILVDCR